MEEESINFAQTHEEQLKNRPFTLSSFEQEAMLANLTGYGTVKTSLLTIFQELKKEHRKEVHVLDYSVKDVDLADIFQAVLAKLPRQWFCEDFLNKL